ncbi:hypothetical protein T484DRAFT_1845870 [Baffinella frigidus]|nr:hypothetical protein T484DRAFT_1845870 [Cryptophyta sp. CCMP2293]
MLARGVMLAMVLAPAAGFLAPASMLPLRASRSATCDRSALCMADEINSKQVAGALGGLLSNLRSGRGVFGEEATKKVARQALDVLEDQVMEVVGEIRSDAPAKSIKRADSATKMAVEEGPPAKPVYSSEDKWDLRLASDPATSLEVTVRPTQKAKLLVKAWAGAFPDMPAISLRLPQVLKREAN